ncbi:hypothetical protein [Pseudoduganella violacea]|uniref:Uncharacterized protein n=1 Tax=Pseudoduganella violacea TaxID=1715466 RepID=A0A7W5FUG2_9BURK|nr:hypothetical protein [Pseudoduganella violacea]MBB3119123.1 hypothetical protein [Pseudoduganella violacea]
MLVGRDALGWMLKMLAAPLLLAPVLNGLPAAKAAASAAETPLLETRPASAAEIKSFAAFRQQQLPETAALPASFNATRLRGSRQWQLQAALDAAPVHAPALPLCVMQRRVFDYAPRAAKDKRWSEQLPAQQLAWLHHQPQCDAPDAGKPPVHPVRLLQAQPDMSTLTLLVKHSELLERARLLMAGNTACAKLRSRSFQLDAVSREPAGSPDAGMVLLVFRSDIGAEAHITVRKSRTELTAWNVRCPAP